MHKPTIRAIALGGLAAGLLTLSIPAAAGGVRLDADCAPVLTGFDRALYEKAGEGTGVLRRHMDARRVLLEQDVYDTAVWAADVAEVSGRCLLRARVAAAGAAGPAVLRGTDPRTGTTP